MKQFKNELAYYHEISYWEAHRIFL